MYLDGELPLCLQIEDCTDGCHGSDTFSGFGQISNEKDVLAGLTATKEGIRFCHVQKKENNKAKLTQLFSKLHKLIY